MLRFINIMKVAHYLPSLFNCICRMELIFTWHRKLCPYDTRAWWWDWIGMQEGEAGGQCWIERTRSTACYPTPFVSVLTRKTPYSKQSWAILAPIQTINLAISLPSSWSKLTSCLACPIRPTWLQSHHCHQSWGYWLDSELPSLHL